MELFPRKYDMISEVTRLEDLMPSYNEIMRALGKVIRNKVWRLSNEDSLAQYLYTCNQLLELTISALGESTYIAEFYIKLLKKHSYVFTPHNIDVYFDETEEMIQQEHTRELFANLWRKANPYYMDEFEDDETYKKSIIELVDEILTDMNNRGINSIFVKEGDLGLLCRGRRQEHSRAEEIYPPTIDVAIKNNSINRWNPPDRRYIYLVDGEKEKDEASADRVCLAELRAKRNETFTLVNFTVQESACEKKLLRLDYEHLAISDIEKQKDEKLEQIIKNDVNVLKQQYPFDVDELNERIRSITNGQKKDVTEIASEYLAKTFFKYLCDVIFVPLDDDEDNDDKKKDRCYKAFHSLALNLEQKGIAGVVYPSTRMKKRKKTGTNIVIFEVDDVIPDEKSLRVIENKENLA